MSFLVCSSTCDSGAGFVLMVKFNQEDVAMKSRLLFLLFLLVLFLGPFIVSLNSSIWSATVWYAILLFVSLFSMKMEKIGSLFSYKKGILLRSLLYLLVLYGLLALTNAIFPQQKDSVQKLSLDPGLIVLALFLAPVAEEIAFRGYTQSVFKKRLGTNGAIVVTSLFFSFFHPMAVFPQIFVTSMLLGTIREAHGSLIPCMIVHCLNNVVALISSL